MATLLAGWLVPTEARPCSCQKENASLAQALTSALAGSGPVYWGRVTATTDRSADVVVREAFKGG